MVAGYFEVWFRSQSADASMRSSLFGLIIIVLLLITGVIGPLIWPLIIGLQGLLFRIASILGG